MNRLLHPIAATLIGVWAFFPALAPGAGNLWREVVAHPPLDMSPIDRITSKTNPITSVVVMMLDERAPGHD